MARARTVIIVLNMRKSGRWRKRWMKLWRILQRPRAMNWGKAVKLQRISMARALQHRRMPRLW